MSKAAKARAKEKRKKEKQNKKQAKRALYESYKTQGINTKSKRFRKNAKKKATSRVRHPQRPCGNPGCIECYGLNFAPFLTRDNKPKDMPQWMYKLWEAKKVTQ